MNTAKMTIRLPRKDLDIAKQYALQHNLSLTGLVLRYFERLRPDETNGIPPEIAAVAGTLPAGIDVRAEYAAAMEAKHSALSPEEAL